MISVLIVGKGKVGMHLYKAFLGIDAINVTLISSRTLGKIPKTDITIIAVSDDAIAQVSSKIHNALVVHTSGSVAMSDLKNPNRKGVFYMLQTFSEDKLVDFNKVPFCLEAEDKNDLALLERLAQYLGNKIYSISSEQRKTLHVAAVFVNNFTNHLYKIGQDICKQNKVPFEILYPLIEETSGKIQKLSPEKAQTGPAIRNDTTTIKNHLNLLDKNQQEIYKMLTASIQKNNN
ncbi:Rossmann-like and DUF2520 domain-containing protein [Polaribacter sp. R77954]|uniref:Rossmann-like and DUF2520 domain-containing protein n=1 Tax=Polaribacter sp. R77954 TaxID=3093870 RepID=UPI0037CAF014